MNRMNIFFLLVLALPLMTIAQSSDLTSCNGRAVPIENLILTVDPTNLAPLDNSPCPYTEGDLTGYLNCMAATYPQDPSYTYALDIVKDADVLNGVSTLDLVLTQRHILGLVPFQDACKTIAADVNGDNKVNVKDMILMRQLILGITTELPAGSWRFFKSDGLNFTGIGADTDVRYAADQFPLTNTSIKAVKVGDVNNSVSL